jgi:hypothetical protein
MLTSSSITKIAPALLAAQKAMGDAIKDAKNPYFKSAYADLNSVREAVTPALHANDIVLLQPTVTTTDGRNFVRTTLLHASGEYILADTEIVCKVEKDPQALGSAISYARRYGLSAMLSVGTADDDAEIATGRTMKAVKTTSIDTTKGFNTTADTKPVGEGATLTGVNGTVSVAKAGFGSFRKSATTT